MVLCYGGPSKLWHTFGSPLCPNVDVQKQSFGASITHSVLLSFIYFFFLPSFAFLPIFLLPYTLDAGRTHSESCNSQGLLKGAGKKRNMLILSLPSSLTAYSKGGGASHTPAKLQKRTRLSSYVYFVSDPFKFLYLWTFYTFIGSMIKTVWKTLNLNQSSMKYRLFWAS